ncbi:MAG: transposase [Candidatus Rhabdochlamydia sp.]
MLSSLLNFNFTFSFRAVEGFFQDLLSLNQVSFKAPIYSQICRRMKMLPLSKNLVRKKQVIDIVLDKAGLKVYGPGQWCASKYERQG